MKADEVIKALGADGWALVRSDGSHQQFRYPSEPGLVTINVQGSRELSQRVLASIERQSEVKLRT
jgi:predicted RNA binding protein YcfA (HicA-like mRNA interferase family)